MHGLILAGGEGSRLAASGISTPKALVRVGGVPQLVRLTRLFARLGCESLTCLLRDDVPLESVSDDLSRLSLPLIIRTCRTPSSLHTLIEGLAHVPPGPVFCSMVDTIMPSRDWVRVYDDSRAQLEAGADAVLAVTPFVDDEQPLYVARGRDGRVTAIGDRTMEPVLVTGGIYSFSERARTAAKHTLGGGHARMRALLRSLVQEGLDVRTVEVAKIIDLDHRRDLDQANAWQEFCDGGGLPIG